MSPRLHPPFSNSSAPALPNAGASRYDARFVDAVLDDALSADDRVYAIAGLQGSGKSTLSAQLVAAARSRGLHAQAVSIDDFYLGRRERQRLGREVHPLLATRGPPGTHDVGFACEVIDALRGRHPVRLPRFDKIADRRWPPSRWPLTQTVDLTIVEGWLLKVPPQSSADLHEPINALERDEDPDGRWRAYCNHALGHEYPALWARLPRLLFLHGPGFEVVPDWRWQQERTLQAVNPGRDAMSRPQVERFVQLFERVSRQALATLPAIAQRTIRLDTNRRPC